jgi:hypothetical protein
MIYTHYCTSHGAQTCSNTTQVTLPDNVVVIMNCKNTPVVCNLEMLIHEWLYCMSPELEWMKTITSFSHTEVMQLMKLYITRISQTFNNSHNSFCIYTGKCPNLVLQKDNKKGVKAFRSGIYTLPVQAYYKNDSLNKILADINMQANNNKVSYYQYFTGQQYQQLMYLPYNMSSLEQMVLRNDKLKYFVTPLNNPNNTSIYNQSQYTVTSSGLNIDELKFDRIFRIASFPKTLSSSTKRR